MRIVYFEDVAWLLESLSLFVTSLKCRDTYLWKWNTSVSRITFAISCYAIQSCSLVVPMIRPLSVSPSGLKLGRHFRNISFVIAS